ncbi:MAG: Ycf66 family protein [Cyanobacteria bacterium]|nr:hypothetical protein [Synechococcus sp. BS307-5m-G38]MDA0257109.1 Ycf66 family protein [Cyanobacteriota bacterium]
MLATLSGDVCLLFGLALLLLPLLAVELSRPRDGVWGAVVLLLGLVLVTSSDRLRGAPMLAVLCGSLLISRLGAEVGQARWRALSEDEQQRLASPEHWLTGLQQLGTAAGSLTDGLGGMAKQLKPGGKSGVSGKRWVRPDGNAAIATADHPTTENTTAQTSPESTPEPTAGPEPTQKPAASDPAAASQSPTTGESED